MQRFHRPFGKRRTYAVVAQIDHRYTHRLLQSSLLQNSAARIGPQEQQKAQRRFGRLPKKPNKSQSEQPQSQKEGRGQAQKADAADFSEVGLVLKPSLRGHNLQLVPLKEGVAVLLHAALPAFQPALASPPRQRRIGPAPSASFEQTGNFQVPDHSEGGNQLGGRAGQVRGGFSR